MGDRWGGVFYLPPGADFASDLVRGLLERLEDAPPEALARVTLYLNSGRTLAAVRAAFDGVGRALLLPRMRLIAELGAGPDLPPPAAPLARRLELARLVDAALAADPMGQSVPALARSLAELMAEMQSEGLDAEALSRVDASDHAVHWQRALSFLKIAADYHLSGAPVDREARQRAAAERLAADWGAGRGLPLGPVVVAGSTGSHGATRIFMDAVAALPLGAVVLPGYDTDTPDALWDELAEAEDHPQARLAPFRPGETPRLWCDGDGGTPAPTATASTDTMAQDGPLADPDDGLDLILAPLDRPCGAASDPRRNRLLSLALRPAPVTDRWITEGPLLGDLPAATARLTLIEADQPGQEAAAIALVIRAAVERGRAVTLIAADRGLTRRVAAALDRWQITPDDSAGVPLPLTATGLFLRHIAALGGEALTLDRLLVLLKHPLTATGADMRALHLLHTRELELHLRRYGPVFPDSAALRTWGDRPPRTGAAVDPARQAWAGWVADMLDLTLPLVADGGPQPLDRRAADHRRLAEAWATGPGGQVEASQLYARQPGEKARAVLDHLALHAPAGPPATAGDFAQLLLDLLQAQAVRQDVTAHPLVRFRGPREARTEAVGLVILGGLNEGGWPQALDPDPWLSRPMRRQAGLTLPERRIGLAAHDFQIAAAADQVILTRARRNDEAETIPSRWLNRMVNLMGGLSTQRGPEALAAMRARGARWLGMAAALARPAADVPRAQRPSPVPPGPALRELSVTQVRTLIRDPYAVYANKVLRLRPLDPLRAEPDAALRGVVLHRIVQQFLSPPAPLSPPGPGDTPEMLRKRLLDAADEVLAEDVPWPSARMFWHARIAAIVGRVAADEHARLQSGAPMTVETQGRLALAGMDFDLTARPDRIDRLRDGAAVVYDYKTGKPPSEAQMKAFDKQLPLTAVMVERGAFGPSLPVDAIRYIRLGGAGETADRAWAEDVRDETWAGFVELIEGYLTGEHGFTARRAMERTADPSDYDHLSRHGEWSLADTPVRIPVGQGDPQGDAP